MNGMKALPEYVFTCGIDDKLKEIDIVNNSYTPFEVKLGSQPRGMDIKGDTIITATVKEVEFVVGPRIICRMCNLIYVLASF